MKPIKDFENYFVDEYGNIYSCKKSQNPKKLKLRLHKTGYYVVHLIKAGKMYNLSVHRLVASAFIPNPKNKPQVNHKDGNKQNNNVDNLEWVTASENCLHKYKALGYHSNNKGKLGKDFYASKKVCQYNLDGTFNREWNAISDAARFYNCNPAQIVNNIAKRNITAHGFLWSYEKANRIDNSKVLNRKTHKNQTEYIKYKR